MAGDIQRAVERVQTIAGGLAGIRAAPTEPPEQMNVFPFAVSYIASVDTTRAVGFTTKLYTIRTEIHVARRDLPRDIRAINPYPALFVAAIWADSQLQDASGATVETVNTLSGSLVASDWGGIETLAWQFDTGVKII